MGFCYEKKEPGSNSLKLCKLTRARYISLVFTILILSLLIKFVFYLLFAVQIDSKVLIYIHNSLHNTEKTEPGSNFKEK